MKYNFQISVLFLTVTIWAVCLAVLAANANNSGKTEFKLSYRKGHTKVTRNVRCSPPSGNHPNPEKVCAALEGARGNFEDLKDNDPNKVCTMEYDPALVIVSGYFKGKPVFFQNRYSNQCMLNSWTKGIFNF